MKSATLPSLRVDPELRKAAEEVLEEGESLSSFIEESVRKRVRYRQAQKDFIARALEAEAEAERTGEYYSIDEVMSGVRQIIDRAKSKS